MAALAFAAARHAELVDEWTRDRRAEVDSIRPLVKRRAALGVFNRRRRALLDSGEAFGTASAIITFYVLEQFELRGWNKAWRVVPDGQAELRGRRYGVQNNPLKDWTGLLRIYLPDDVAEQLRRATWWTSWPATRELLRLRELDPQGLNASVNRRRQRVLERIVTTGDVLRAALDEATKPWFPTDAEVRDSRLGAVAALLEQR
ncbi:hypothetical protein [Lentzea sp. NBRC 102530]|uniref:hypothetical protein n=1 Tax=Lentzea sp. NBRC 102530 TaxID=3032201 RepID=UPI002557AE3A|nr:hypothetical protein [Lentzea sp. NBRC 102530]